jgi:hypothetical protein
MTVMITLIGLVLFWKCFDFVNGWAISSYRRPATLLLNSIGLETTSNLKSHNDLFVNRLDNGLLYKIFPNKKPHGRFEAHLEILSGSAIELEQQQGMAHMLEHVAYMGSVKRQHLSGEFLIRYYCNTNI